MYLSSIELVGFKSFAQRINLKFDSGITGIVGPNGCGKTNIVDAIRWVLGEQRYSTLRSEKMEDVIFNGTKNRKPVGMAEATLVIENTKGILPTEYSEVTISRRIFRSGESEYLLNKVPCRLKDILDLFMDTGMGADAYSVIELKMVEAILSDRTDERRRLFEEAAGITKYKHRRKTAYRKLESIQNDLSRVNDIVKEVQKTVSSLERQAKKAEQYNELSSKLRVREIELLEQEYANYICKLQPVEEKYELTLNEKQKIDKSLAEAESHLDELRTTIQEIEEKLNLQHRLVNTARENVRKYEEQILIAKERSNTLIEQIEYSQIEKENLAQQKLQLEQEQVKLGAKLNQFHIDYELLQHDYNATKNELNEALLTLEANKSKVQNLNDIILKLTHEIVQKHGECDRQNTKLEHLRSRFEKLQEESHLFQDDITRSEDTVNRLLNEDKNLHRRLVDAELQLFKQESFKKNLKEEIDQLQSQILSLSNEVQRKSEKIEFLNSIIENKEGCPEGIRLLLQQENWKGKNLKTVADVLDVPDQYRVAIEAVLGEMGNFVIVDIEEDAYAAIDTLKKLEKGRATFICLSKIPLKYQSTKTQNVGIRAVDVIRCKDQYRSLIDFIFDDVIIVKSPDKIDNFIKSSTAVRCVTLEGQLLSSNGVIHGGKGQFLEGEHIGKEAKIASLEQEISKLQETIEQLSQIQKEKIKHYEEFDLSIYRDTVKSIEKETTAVEIQMAQVEFEKKRALEGLNRNSQELLLIEREITDMQNNILEIDNEYYILQQKKDKLESEQEEAQIMLEGSETNYEIKSSALSEKEIKIVTLQGELKNIERELERIQKTKKDIEDTIIRRSEEIQFAQAEIDRLKIDIEKNYTELTVRQIELNDLEEQKRTIEQMYNQKRDQLHQIELRIRDDRRTHDEITETTHDLKIQIAEIKSNLEHLKEQAKQSFEIDLQHKVYSNDEKVNLVQVQEEVKNLKEKIRLLGPINFAAFDEYSSESERLKFLTQQQGDLLEAEKTLIKTINEINTTAQHKFLESFQKIRENFILIFKELFDEGDECDLKLEDKADPLEANIEIIAKPRGKRPTSIDLLSGGEKALTAIALLFAIYLVKPSPFCILDEVDAPLDDSNIDRFTRILRKFSNNTQFIVVTHNKRTMEAANTLYGVTMEEEGVSKIVTVRFNDESRVRSAVVSA